MRAIQVLITGFLSSELRGHRGSSFRPSGEGSLRRCPLTCSFSFSNLAFPHRHLKFRLTFEINPVAHLPPHFCPPPECVFHDSANRSERGDCLCLRTRAIYSSNENVVSRYCIVPLCVPAILSGILPSTIVPSVAAYDRLNIECSISMSVQCFSGLNIFNRWYTLRPLYQYRIRKCSL